MPDNTNAQMQARIAELEKQLAEAKAKPAAKISFKVSEKGGVSAYGLGRFPVTLYGEQWKRLAAAMPELLKFVEAHASELSSKPATSQPAAK